MPSYSETFYLKAGSEAGVPIHVFDYIDPNVAIPSRNIKVEDHSGTHNKKQLICMSPCLFSGTKNLSTFEKEKWNLILQKGQQFEGYFIRTKNGKYDYCYKIWTNRRLPFAPLNYPSPKENKAYEVIIIDKNGDYLGLAAGPHLAFCKVEDMKANGDLDVDVDNLSFPCVGGVAKLVRAMKEKPAEIPYAAYQAVPSPKDSQESEGAETGIKEEGSPISGEEGEETGKEEEEEQEKILINIDNVKNED